MFSAAGKKVGASLVHAFMYVLLYACFHAADGNIPCVITNQSALYLGLTCGGIYRRPLLLLLLLLLLFEYICRGSCGFCGLFLQADIREKTRLWRAATTGAT